MHNSSQTTLYLSESRGCFGVELLLNGWSRENFFWGLLHRAIFAAGHQKTKIRCQRSIPQRLSKKKGGKKKNKRIKGRLRGVYFTSCGRTFSLHLHSNTVQQQQQHLLFFYILDGKMLNKIKKMFPSYEGVFFWIEEGVFERKKSAWYHGWCVVCCLCV